MPDVIGEAFVAIRPTGQKEFQQEVQSNLKAIATQAAGVFGGIQLNNLFGKGTALFADFISEAREANKVGAQTEAVLKSTGGQAGITADQIGKLAEATSEKVAVDDEAIQSGENLLLTFTKVRNEAGKGNDVFNQATKVALDMSAALGQDLQSSVIQLGKALNDPIAGVTALRRVGVSFTEDQQKQIAALIQSNDLLGAQKIVLAELKTEFGGSAAAIATDADRLNVAFKNFEESAGKQILPLLDGFLRGGIAVLKFIDAMGGLITVAPAVITAIGLIGLAFDSALGPIGIAVGAAGILVTFAQRLGIIGEQAKDTSDNATKLAESIVKTNSALGAAAAFDNFNKNLDGVAKGYRNAADGFSRFEQGQRGALTALANFIRLSQASPAAAQLVIDGLKAQGRETKIYEQALASSIERTKGSTAAKAAEAAQNRALLSTIEDLNDAVLKSSGTQAGYEQAVLDVGKAQDELTGAQLDQIEAQKDYDAAVRDHGASSEEAYQAGLKLADANGAVKDATIGVTRAQLDAVGAAQALDDATTVLNDTIGGSPEKIQAEIDKLEEAKRLHPEVASSYDPIIARLKDMKKKLDEIPKDVPVVIRLEGVEVTQAQLDAIRGQINGLIGAGGAGLPIPGTGGQYIPQPRYGPNGEYLGTFAAGLDRVPGPDGKPWLATVHGGEEIVPAGDRRGDHYEITIYDKTGNPTERAIQMVERHRLAQALR